MDFEQVRELLAHRFPMLMIDRVVELEAGKRIVALKNVTGNEMHFLGHFPSQAIMPGVLIIEAMAQAAALVSASGRAEAPKTSQDIQYLSSVNVRFTKPVVPGDQLQIEIEVIKQVDYGAMVRAVARVGDTIAAKGELVVGGRRRV